MPDSSSKSPLSSPSALPRAPSTPAAPDTSSRPCALYGLPRKLLAQSVLLLSVSNRPNDPRSERRRLKALSSFPSISSLQHLKKRKKRMSLLEASSCLMAGFSARRQTLLLGDHAQKPHIFGTRTKALRLLMSRPAQDTITALNAVTRERIRIMFL